MMLAPLKKSVNGLMVQWCNMQQQSFFVDFIIIEGKSILEAFPFFAYL